MKNPLYLSFHLLPVRAGPVDTAGHDAAKEPQAGDFFY